MAIICIELCGRLADCCGRTVTIDLPAAGMSVADLIAAVASQQPAISAIPVRACINNRIVAQGALVMPGDAVALFPPVSGG